MATQAEKLVLNGATSQLDRWLAVLEDGYAPVDGRSYEELLAFAPRYGALLNFYDLADQPDGDWVCFFLSDPVVVLASIVAFDTTAFEAEIEALCEGVRGAAGDDERDHRLGKAHRGVFDLVRRVDRWQRGLRGSQDTSAGRLMLEEMRPDLEGELAEPLRRLGLSSGEGALMPGSAGGDQRWDLSLARLERIGAAFLGRIDGWRQRARQLLKKCLKRENHRPQIALYMAFLRLFETAQHTLNTFSTRYRDFYYQDVLRGTLRGPMADRVYLTFTLAEEEGVERTSVPTGTLFPAGTDAEGQEILYGARHGLEVSAAQLETLQALRSRRGRLLPPRFGGSSEVVRKVLATEISTDSTAPAGWATFGQAQSGEVDGVEQTRPATLGFALASPYLLLTGGERSITLEVQYPEAFRDDVLLPLLEELAEATGLGEEEIWRRLLAKAFRLRLSTVEGWFGVEKYAVLAAPLRRGRGGAHFTLGIELPPTAPPVVAPEVEEGDESLGNPSPQQPMLAAVLRQRRVILGDGPLGVYPLSLLEGLPVERIELGVEVCALPGLELENTDGTVDPSSPFPFFGGLPVVGSYLRVRHLELFQKQVQSLSLSVHWFALPQNATGFKGYYRDYVLGLSGRPQPDLFNNRSFKGRVFVRNPGLWDLYPEEGDDEDAGVEAFLFRSRSAADPEGCSKAVPPECGHLCADSTFDQWTMHSETPPPYYDPEQSALEVELIDPPYAFGNDLYAQNVLNAVIQDLPDTEKCQTSCLSKCRVLEEAVALVAQCQKCLGACADEECRKQCLDQCIDGLFQKYLCCLEGCQAEVGSEESALWHIQRDLMAAMARSGTERARGIEQGRCELVRLWDESRDDCFWKCLAILETILCIELCRSVPGELDDGLEGCRKQLEEAYAVCVKRCMDSCMHLGEELKYPNDPYLPQAEQVRIDYGAGCSLRFSLPEEEAACGELYHLLPFGGFERASISGESDPPQLLPRVPPSGELYLGFTGLMPPQKLTLLFQMASGEGRELPPVHWSYLSDNRWFLLGEHRVPSDTTNGLENTGIVTLDLPSYGADGNTVLTSDQQWLRASVATDAGDFPNTLAITPHALTASWVDQGTRGNHLEEPLPAHTITGSVQNLADIGSIDQPMASFGGRPAETERTFVVRMGERLRHKERAVLAWDYERLVLERFSTVWKVGVLPVHDALEGGHPGDVLVMIVPGPDGGENLDPTAPKASSAELAEIRCFLEQHSNPFVQIHVMNPVYVRVEVEAEVVLASDGEDSGALANRLNRELVRYLSPWYFDAERAAEEGEYATEANISEFIRTRPYVVSLRSLELNHTPPPEALAADWYFLTSALEHRITVPEPRGIRERC